jgi:hypothetical protein
MWKLHNPVQKKQKEDSWPSGEGLSSERLGLGRRTHLPCQLSICMIYYHTPNFCNLSRELNNGFIDRNGLAAFEFNYSEVVGDGFA